MASRPLLVKHKRCPRRSSTMLVHIETALEGKKWSICRPGEEVQDQKAVVARVGRLPRDFQLPRSLPSLQNLLSVPLCTSFGEAVQASCRADSAACFRSVTKKFLLPILKLSFQSKLPAKSTRCAWNATPRSNRKKAHVLVTENEVTNQGEG